MAYSWPGANPGDRILMTFTGTLNGQITMSTFWYGIESVVGTPTKLQVSDELVTAVSAANKLWTRYRDSYPNNGTLDEVWVQFIDPTRFAKVVYTKGVNGLSSSSADTSNLAAVILRRGVYGNKRNVSTLHMPIATTSTWVENGLLTEASNGSLALLAQQMVNPITTATGHVLLPIIRNGPATLEFNFIGAAYVQQTVRVMRRRTVRLGI